MKKKSKINIERESPNKDNLDEYFSKTVTLYGEGKYEEALEGLEKLSEFNYDLKVSLIPHIERCKHIKKKLLTSSDKRHLKNQAILKHFGWVDKLKYLTGMGSFAYFGTLLFSEDATFLDNISKYPEYLAWAIVLAILTYLIHVFMRKFTISAGLIRCKYCGRYIQYIDPNKPTFGFMETNSCNECNRMYPAPDFNWDSWAGLEYIENRHSVPEEAFYKEFKKLKNKFSKEYGLWKHYPNKKNILE